MKHFEISGGGRESIWIVKVEYDDKEEIDWIRSGGLGCVRQVRLGLLDWSGVV